MNPVVAAMQLRPTAPHWRPEPTHRRLAAMNFRMEVFCFFTHVKYRHTTCRIADQAPCIPTSLAIPDTGPELKSKWAQNLARPGTARDLARRLQYQPGEAS
jgi:hypothetical protein